MVLVARRLRFGLVMGVVAGCVTTGCVARAAVPDELTKQILEAQQPSSERGNAAKGESRTPGANDQNLRELLKKRAIGFEKIHQTEQAEADFTAALDVQPIDPTLYADRGYFYLRQKRFAQALADFTTGSRVDPNNPLFVFATGRVHAAQADFPGAIERYNDALRIDGAYAVALISRAEAYVHLGRLQDAKQDYDQTIALAFKRAGDRYFAYLGRGYINILLQDFDAAVRDLDQALDAQPGDLNALLYRGYAYELRGTSELALRDYERAFVESPGNPWVRTSLQRLRSN